MFVKFVIGTLAIAVAALAMGWTVRALWLLVRDALSVDRNLDRDAAREMRDAEADLEAAIKRYEKRINEKD